jgi:serine/threonine protein kinase
MSNDDHVLIADFGLAGLGDTMTVAAATTTSEDRTIRWSAPELHDPESCGFDKFRRTRATDIYAFGCIALEVSMVIILRQRLVYISQLFTGEQPFANVPARLDFAVIRKVLAGELPVQQPPPNLGIQQGVWSLIRRCWSKNASERPQISEAIRELQAWSFLATRKQWAHAVVECAARADVHEAHLLLATQCLRVMNEQLRQDICDIRDPGKLNSEITDLSQRLDANVSEELRYACVHWAEHLTSIRATTEELLEQVQLFCQWKILFWIELMSLLGCFWSSIRMLASTKAWYSVRCYRILRNETRT